MFGGSARYCLSRNGSFVSEGEKQVTIAIEGINNISQWKDLFTEGLDVKSAVHCVMLQMPEDDKLNVTLYSASLSVSKMLYMQVKAKLNESQSLLVEILNRMG